MCRISILLIAGLMLLAAWTLPLSATTVREGSLFDDLQLAEAVITATVETVRVEEDERGIPYTVYTLANVEAIKGEEPTPYEVRIAGGMLPSGVSLEVSGVPKFARGDEVLLFLRADNEICPIIGLQARTFRVEQRQGQSWIVTYDGMPIMGLDTALRIERGPTKAAEGLSLEQFRFLLEEMMAQPEYLDRSR